MSPYILVSDILLLRLTKTVSPILSQIEKLNSHRWAFNAFCPQLRPNVCVLLDVGTRPGGTSIYSLWLVFCLFFLEREDLFI